MSLISIGRGMDFPVIYFDNDDLDRKDPLYGTLALTGRGGEVSYKHEWNMGQRIDGIHDFWDDFSSDGRLSHEKPLWGRPGGWIHLLPSKLDPWHLLRHWNPGRKEFSIFVFPGASPTV